MKNRNDDLKVLQCVTGRCTLQKVNSIFAKKKAQNIIVQCWTVYYIWNIVQDRTQSTMNLRERVNFKFGEWDMRYHIFHDRNLSSYDNQIYNCWINGWLTKLCCCCYFLFFSFFYLYFRTNRLLPDTCIMTQCSSLWRNHCTSSLYSLINKLNFSYAVPPSFWWYNIIP